MTVATEDRTVETFANGTYEIPKELEISKNDVLSKDCGIFRIMSPKDGDKRVVWNRMNIAEIKAAKKMFMDLISKGMTPYKVGTDGKQSSTEMKEFDPLAEEVIFVPIRAIAGG